MSAAEALSTQPRGAFRLFSLPPELRLRIIEFAVIEPKPIVISHSSFMDNGSNSLPSIAHETEPAIAKTCYSIREDALKAYYRLNDFEADFCQESNCWPKLQRWLPEGSQAEKQRSRKETRLLMPKSYREYVRCLRLSDQVAKQHSDVEGARKCMKDCEAELLAVGALITPVEGDDYSVVVSFPAQRVLKG